MLEAVRHTTLLIGMHSDSSATEAIVHIALHYCKPFMVVPCCVFLNFFKQQFLPSEEAEGKMVPVRSRKQFCRYLALKDSHFAVETLLFEGRNTCILWDGKQSADRDEVTTAYRNDERKDERKK